VAQSPTATNLTRWNLTDGGGVEAVVVVAVPGLDEDGEVREAVGEHFSIDVTKLNTWNPGKSTSSDVCKITEDTKVKHTNITTIYNDN
jgi:hypothetical protein